MSICAVFVGFTNSPNVYCSRLAWLVFYNTVAHFYRYMALRKPLLAKNTGNAITMHFLNNVTTVPKCI